MQKDVELLKVCGSLGRQLLYRPDVYRLQMKRQISEGDLHNHQVNIFMKGLAHFCDSWLGNRDTTQTRLNIDNPIGPLTASLSEGLGKVRGFRCALIDYLFLIPWTDYLISDLGSIVSVIHHPQEFCRQGTREAGIQRRPCP